MVCGFKMGGDWWTVHPVPPSSPFLIDRTGRLTVATTDAAAKAIRVSTAVREPLLTRVMVHEAAHAAMESFGIAKRIRSMVPARYRIEVEETICNIISDYGLMIIASGMSAADAVSTAADAVA